MIPQDGISTQPREINRVKSIKKRVSIIWQDQQHLEPECSGEDYCHIGHELKDRANGVCSPQSIDAKLTSSTTPINSCFFFNDTNAVSHEARHFNDHPSSLLILCRKPLSMILEGRLSIFSQFSSSCFH